MDCLLAGDAGALECPRDGTPFALSEVATLVHFISCLSVVAWGTYVHSSLDADVPHVLSCRDGSRQERTHVTSEGSEHRDHEDAEAVLAGERSYDEVGGESQAIVRDEWAKRIAIRREDLDYAAEFREQGLGPWSEGNEEGKTQLRS